MFIHAMGCPHYDQRAQSAFWWACACLEFTSSPHNTRHVPLSQLEVQTFIHFLLFDQIKKFLFSFFVLVHIGIIVKTSEYHLITLQLI